MKCPFSLLDLPAHAALDAEVLQKAYLDAVKSAAGDERILAELNEAVQLLESPVSRLKYLLGLQKEVGWRAIPLEGELMSLFDRLGSRLQLASAHVQKKEKMSSALGKALMAPAEMRLREELESLNAEIEQDWKDLENGLSAWDAAGNCDWKELQALQARFAYLQKWRDQIRECLLGLML